MDLSSSSSKLLNKLDFADFFFNYFFPFLLQEYMVYRKHTYIRLDGSSKISERRDMVADFQSRWVKLKGLQDSVDVCKWNQTSPFTNSPM